MTDDTAALRAEVRDAVRALDAATQQLLNYAVKLHNPNAIGVVGFGPPQSCRMTDEMKALVHRGGRWLDHEGTPEDA